MKSQSILFLISAPSGGGKTTVMNGLLEAIPGLRRVVTCTTRAPRPSERDGVEYHFFRPADFELRVAEGEFLEHADVYGFRYGTRREAVMDLLKSGADGVLSLDVQGAATVKQLAATDPVLKPALVTAFITPPTLAELEYRLRSRAGDSEAAIQRRLASAEHEVLQWPTFDYLILSDTRESDLARMQSIFTAEKSRCSRLRFDFGR
ncbi:MAG: guanylate kinase [Pedosphaera sp.]|nr:guanylate kinase [Pedosphaera sp.]